MQFSTNFVDLEQTPLADDKNYYDWISREARDSWVVAHSQIYTDGRDTAWMTQIQTDKVGILLVPYLTPVDPSYAMGFLFQLGFAAAQSIPANVEQIHLSIGRPINHMQQGNSEHLQIYIGVAAKLGE